MSELSDEWVVKADADFFTAGRELVVQEKPNYDVSFRYPGESADQQDAQESFRIATAMRTRLLSLIRGQT